MQQHYAGDIGHTSTRKPLELVWQGEFETRQAALDFEQQVKGWSRAKKEALIAGDWERMKELAKSRVSPSAGSGRTDGRGPSTGSGRTGLGVVQLPEWEASRPVNGRPYR